MTDQPPKRTEEMKKQGQVWAWIWDTPQPAPPIGSTEWPGPDYDHDAPGRWEIRGTGVLLEEIMNDEPPVCRHCGDPIQLGESGHWAHVMRPGSLLYNCQHTVPYGQRAEP